MRINYNVSAMWANNALSNNDSLFAKSIERLSSGLKINHAKDGPSGLAMAKRMNAQIEGLSAASQNSSDGISIIETADGAMVEVSDMLQRINELSIKASNGTMSDKDRVIIQDEVKQLKEEITRVCNSTQFNGQNLLNGEFDQKGYTNFEGIKVMSYTSEVTVKEFTIKSLTIKAELDADGNPTGNKTIDINNGIDLGSDFPQGVDSFEIKDNILTLKGDNSFEMKLDLSGLDLEGANSVTFGQGGTKDAIKVDVKGIGAMRLQIGANEGQVLEISIPAISLRNMGIEDIDVSTKEGADEAVAKLDGAISYVSSVRGRLGAYQNRLESSINSLDITSENMTAAYSRIMDVDMAEEMTSYTTYQVLTQAGTSMLAQANERPSQVLQLLQ